MVSLIDLLEREKELNEKIARVDVEIDCAIDALNMANEEKQKLEDKLKRIRGFIKKYYEEL